MFTRNSKTPHWIRSALTDLQIDELSKIPKYKQVADHIICCIGKGNIDVGDKIPSINEASEELLLSRDTVEKAFKNLSKRGIITAVHGKGFYLATTQSNDKKRILLVLNKLSDHKNTIYNSFLCTLGQKYQVDLQIHDGEGGKLEKIIIECLGKYDYYVIMPMVLHETESVKSAINKVPKGKLFLLNKEMTGISGPYGCVYEDFELDIHQALYMAIAKIKKYRSLILIFPRAYDYCIGIKNGFTRFCKEERFHFEICDQIASCLVEEGELYIVIEETDLIELIKKSADKNLVLGKQIGIITYNDSPFKEILAGGITVVSTNFSKMGQTLANMIKDKEHIKIKNPFELTIRNSI